MTSGEPTRITVNLTPRAVAARDAATARTAGNTTSTINRALLVYALLTERYGLADPHGMVVTQPDGTRERVYLT